MNEDERSDSNTIVTLPPPCLIPNLPNEIAVSCIARVPRPNHPYLSSVSRCWHSLLHSPLFYTVRYKLNISQQFLYITVCGRRSFSFQWFVLDPHAPSTMKLSPLPSPPFRAARSASAVLGPQIFFMGGSSVGEIPSPNVWIFDTRFNRWEMGPRMRVSRESAMAGVINGKIYVLGGCCCPVDSWVEVFDPAVGSWAPVSIPPVDFQYNKPRLLSGAVLDGKFYAMAEVKPGGRGIFFDPVAGAYGNASIELYMGWRRNGAVVDGILYCYYYQFSYLSNNIKGYNIKENKWEEVEGLETGLPMRDIFGVTLVNVGGRLCMVWGGKGTNGLGMQIRFTIIEVFRDTNGGLRGRIARSRVLLALTRRFPVADCWAVGL